MARGHVTVFQHLAGSAFTIPPHVSIRDCIGRRRFVQRRGAARLSLLPLIPQGVSPSQYYLCVGAAVLIMGVSKAGFGGGVGILSIPLMAIGMGADGTTQMMGVMLPVLIACDV